MNILKNENGITVKQLKAYVKDLPETDENGEDYEVFIQDDTGKLSNICVEIWPLNDGDILLVPEF